MYEELTVESIKNDIISRMSTDINTSEGSFINDMISPVAYEIWKAYQSLDTILPIAFVDETSGEYIDKRCAEYGIIRKAGTKAKTTLMFTGTDGTLIPKGKVFLTSDSLQFETEDAVTIVSGTTAVVAIATEIGTDHNVDEGTITRQLISISGLTSITNSAATGGTDPESDAALVKRLYEYLQRPATSGNAAHYRQWALEIDGVGAAKVAPLWNGSGTVKVLVVGNDNGPVDATIISNCTTHIEEKRPIGATVTVVSAEGLSINVAATVTIDSTTTVETVQTAFRNTLNEYLKSIAFTKYTLVYNRIAYMMLDIEGVLDYTSLTINGDISSVAIGEDQVPILGSVVINHEAY